MGVTLTTKLYTCHVTRDGVYAPPAFPASPEADCVNYQRPTRAVPRQQGTCRIDGTECDATPVAKKETC